MTKLIEMLLDGRLSLILAFLIPLVVWEVWPLCREHARRVYLARRYGKSARYYK